jgi:hypothetical protein
MIMIWRIRGVMVERMIEIMDGRKIRLFNSILSRLFWTIHLMNV